LLETEDSRPADKNELFWQIESASYERFRWCIDVIQIDELITYLIQSLAKRIVGW
jgi:hypothetical protein